jgi:prevent-host-death family protein
MQNVSVHEAKTHLSRLLKKIEAGEDIVITSRGKPVATLTSPPKKKKRILGDLAHLASQFVMPGDFDEPMPEEWFDDPEDPLNTL